MTTDTITTPLARHAAAVAVLAEHLQHNGVHDVTSMNLYAPMVRDSHLCTLTVATAESFTLLLGDQEPLAMANYQYAPSVDVGGIDCTIIGPPAPWACPVAGCDVVGKHKHQAAL